VVLAACGSVAGKNPDAAVDSKQVDGQTDARGIDAFTCAANPTGLAGRWRAEMNVNDDLNAAPGTQNGGVIYSAGKHGYAFVLDGSSKWVSIADNDALWPSGSFSLEAWVKTTTTSSSQIIQKYQCAGSCPANQSTALYAMGVGAAGTPYFDCRSDTSQNIQTVSDTGHPVNDGNWHHLVGVRDVTAAQMILYVDGAFGASLGISGVDLEALSNTDNEVDLITIGTGTVGGTSNHANFFAGSIDEVSYYSAALTAQEVARIYAAPEGECH
jgi:hypothetical protein